MLSFSPLLAFSSPTSFLLFIKTNKQINKQSRYLLKLSFLSRRKELTNSVILRFIPARKLAILKSNFKTLKTKESLPNGGLPGPQKVGEGKRGLRCHGTSGYVDEADAVYMMGPAGDGGSFGEGTGLLEVV